MPAVRKFLFSGLLAIAIFVFSNTISLAFSNGDFESSDLLPWEAYNGAKATVLTDYAHGGIRAVRVENDSPNSYGIQQVVTGIIPGTTYRFSGYSKVTDPNVSKVFLRIAWYESSDGSGTQKTTDDSDQIAEISDWVELMVEKPAPAGAASAKTRAVLASKTNGIFAFTYFDDLAFGELVPTPTPAPTPTPSPSPTPTPTSTPTPLAYFKINEVKNQQGEILSAVKIYVDDIYIGHYPPEILEFCDGCKCDAVVSCGFGSHTIKLEKKDYLTWSEQKTFVAGDSYEVNPVLQFSPTPTSAPVPTSAATPLPTPKPGPSPTATESGEVLGEEESSPAAFYGLETPSPPAGQEEKLTPAKRGNKLVAFLLLAAGLGLLFVGALWGWYTRVR